MFNWFKRRNERDAMEKKYRQLLAEAHRLSTVDRKASDLKHAEAHAVLQAMERLPAGRS